MLRSLERAMPSMKSYTDRDLAVGDMCLPPGLNTFYVFLGTYIIPCNLSLLRGPIDPSAWNVNDGRLWEVRVFLHRDRLATQWHQPVEKFPHNASRAVKEYYERYRSYVC